MVVSGNTFEAGHAYGTLAGVALAEAITVGVIGTVRKNPTLVAASGVLVAAAYVFTGLWLSSDGPELVAGAAGAAAVLLFTWTIGHLTHPSSYRIRLWLPVVGVGSQLAAAATLAAAWTQLDAVPAAAVTAGVLGVV